jgi:CRISPR system Cascade subunit CasA
MKEIEFNLLDEPWIRVRDDSCQVHEVSLTDALLHAHQYTSLSGELPTQDIVILRLMLAVLHTVFSRVDADGNAAELEDEEEAVERWTDLWELGQLPEEPIREYLEKWHERFWLFHPERPFGQVAGLAYGTQYGASKLNGEILESGNKVRLFSSYFGEEKTALSYAQAARWLLYLNAFDDSSGKPKGTEKKEGDDKLQSIGVGWLGKLGVVFANGENLFETLLLNLVMVNGNQVESKEKPLWESSSVCKEERRKIPLPDNLAELYTLQSRRISLERENDVVTSYHLIGGDFFQEENAFIEPMTMWKIEKETTYKPQLHNYEKQMWRDFALLYDNRGNNHIVGVIQWIQCIAERINLQMIQTSIVSVQYVKKKSSVENIFWDSLMVNKQLLIDIGANWREKIKVEINRCEQLADAIRKLAGNLYLASGGTKGDAKSWDKTFLKSRESASAQLYFRLDMPFRRWLAGITPEDVDSADYETEERVFSAWQKTAKTIAYSCAEELAMHAGDAAMVGHEITNEKSGDSVRYSAPKAIHQFRIQVAEIYKKI